MAALILEVLGRHGSHFYRFDKATVRIGRALDNDVIVSDPTVSPYHAVIRCAADGRCELHSIADENGIRVGRRLLREPLVIDRFPLQLDAGRTRIRILEPGHPVAPTRLLPCRDGRSCLFGHWGWSLVLFSIFFVLSATDNYLSTPKVLNWETYWRDQLLITVVATGLAMGLVALNRLLSHRWDFASSLGFVSIVLVVGLLIDLTIPFVDYFFTSALPGFAASLLWSLLLLPAALAWYLIRLQHANPATSILVVVMLLSPGAYLQIRELIEHYDLFDDFSRKAFYSTSLVPGDTRLLDTVSINEFVEISTRETRPEYTAE